MIKGAVALLGTSGVLGAGSAGIQTLGGIAQGLGGGGFSNAAAGFTSLTSGLAFNRFLSGSIPRGLHGQSLTQAQQNNIVVGNLAAGLQNGISALSPKQVECPSE